MLKVRDWAIIGPIRSSSREGAGLKLTPKEKEYAGPVQALPHRSIRWQDWSGEGLEHLFLTEEVRGISAKSVVISGRPSDGFAALYSLKLDSDWCCLEVEVSIPGRDKSASLCRTKEGDWLDRNGNELSLLRGAVDVDLSISPFTNSLPIRRLRLEIGQSADIATAYIQFPELAVSRDPQRYTRLSADTYRYESVTSDFVRDIVVDREGLVVTYPGLFRRIS